MALRVTVQRLRVVAVSGGPDAWGNGRLDLKASTAALERGLQSPVQVALDLARF